MYTVTQPDRVEVIDDSDLYRGRQSYDELLTVTVDKMHRIRISIHRDTSYDFQSAFRAERWTGNEWKEVAHVPALSERGTAMPKGFRVDDPSTTIAAVNEMIDHLIFDLVIPIVVG